MGTFKLFLACRLNQRATFAKIQLNSFKVETKIPNNIKVYFWFLTLSKM